VGEEISCNTYINIMAQYRPCYKAPQIPALGRQISSAEFREALSFAQEAGLSRLARIHRAELLPILSE
jgi:putative pyruvate formate lyase activating enzyme